MNRQLERIPGRGNGTAVRNVQAGEASGEARERYGVRHSERVSEHHGERHALAGAAAALLATALATISMFVLHALLAAGAAQAQEIDLTGGVDWFSGSIVTPAIILIVFGLIVAFIVKRAWIAMIAVVFIGGFFYVAAGDPGSMLESAGNTVSQLIGLS